MYRVALILSDGDERAEREVPTIDEAAACVRELAPDELQLALKAREQRMRHARLLRA